MSSANTRHRGVSNQRVEAALRVSGTDACYEPWAGAPNRRSLVAFGACDAIEHRSQTSGEIFRSDEFLVSSGKPGSLEVGSSVDGLGRADQIRHLELGNKLAASVAQIGDAVAVGVRHVPLELAVDTTPVATLGVPIVALLAAVDHPVAATRQQSFGATCNGAPTTAAAPSANRALAIIFWGSQV